MPLYSSLSSLSQTAASNVADGSVDAPSTIDQQTNLLASFIAQLRDGNGFATGVGNVGQCQLVKSGSNIVLLPFGGNGLTINGVVYKIPSAGVSLAPTSLTPGTVYNIYAYMSGSTMTLEASTTARATDTTTGMQIKSGDATRTLVGKVKINAGPAFADTEAQRFVISWFNQKPKRIYVQNAGSVGTNSATPVAIIPFMEFLAWGDGCIPGACTGSVANNTANSTCFTALAIDTNTSFAHAPVAYQAYNTSTQGSASAATTFVPTEGYHYIYTLGQVSGGGTATWQANLEHSGVIQG